MNVKLLSVNTFTEEWLKDLRTTFESGWLAQAGKVKEFEEKFCKEFWYNYAVGMNSGTAALDLAFHLAGIKKRDKVLTPVLTCTATNIPLIHRKAKIQFVDINKDTLTMDFDDFYKKVKRAKAIVTVNLGGIGCDKRIYEVAKERKIPVIVDACQSLGIAEMNGDYVCYSFQAIKHFTTGDGGMLVVRNEIDYERAKQLRWFGIDRDRRHKLNFNFTPTNREMCMNMDEPGFKSHMNDIQATMGLVGLKHSNEDLHRRIDIANLYKFHLSGLVPVITGGSYWLLAVLLEDRDNGKMDRIKKAGIGCDLIHLRNDIFTPFGSKRQKKLPNMDYIEPRYLYLPIHSQLTNEEVEYVAKKVLEVEGLK